MIITIKSSDYKTIYDHALSVAPEEACGLVAGVDNEDGSRDITKVYILTNIDHTN